MHHRAVDAQEDELLDPPAPRGDAGGERGDHHADPELPDRAGGRTAAERGIELPGRGQHHVADRVRCAGAVGLFEHQSAGLVDVDGDTDGTLSTVDAQVFDVLVAKHWAIKYATSAAIDVLKVDSIIMSKPAGIKAPGRNPNWDDD